MQVTWWKRYVVITSTNEDVDMLNEKIISMFPRLEKRQYIHLIQLRMTQKFASARILELNLGWLPPHKLILKMGASIILLRNIDRNLIDIL